MKAKAPVAMLSVLLLAGCAAPTARSGAPALSSGSSAAAFGNEVPVRTLALAAAIDEGPGSNATTQPALPSGHPDISSLGSGSETPPPALPAGHPDISQLSPGPSQSATPTIPPGHPPMGGAGMNQPSATGGPPQLPTGHPDISQLAPATQPSAGTLIVHAVQGTAGAPPIGAEPVAVEVYSGTQLLGKIETKLDANGLVQVDNVPTGPGFQVVARVTHGGVEFDGVIEPRGANIQLNVPVYESTEVKPEWSAYMRHVIVTPAAGGLQVTEVLSLQNPSDRAWLGILPEGAAGDARRVSFTILLPKAATDIKVAGGFHTCCAKVENNTIQNTMALMPGITQYQFAYVLPLTDNRAELPVTFAAPVKTMMVMLDSSLTATGTGLDGPRTVNMGNGNSVYFKGMDLPAGKDVKLSIDASMVGVKKSSTGANAGPRPTFDAATAAKAIAGVGGLLVVLVGGAAMFMKSPRQLKTSRR